MKIDYRQLPNTEELLLTGYEVEGLSYEAQQELFTILSEDY